LLLFAGYEYDGAIMITASHLPYNRNGFKLFTHEGGFEKGDVAELLELAAAEHAAEDAPNTHPSGRHSDDAFVLCSALYSDPGLIEKVWRNS
jgi:phosphomannomutase